MLSKKFKPLSKGSLMLTSPRPALNSLSRCRFLDLGQKIILSSAFVCHCHMLWRPAFMNHKVLLVSRRFFGDALDGLKRNPEKPETSQGLVIFLQDQEKFVTIKWLSYFFKCHQVSYQSGLFLPPHFIVDRAKNRCCDKSSDAKLILCDDFNYSSTAFSGLHWETQIMTLGKWQDDQKVTQQWTALTFFQTTWLELDLYSCEIK